MVHGSAGSASSPGGDPPSIDDFEVVDKIGEGGSSVVYRAVHRPMSLEVSLKVLRGDLDEAQRRRFLQEARLQWRLADHPHVVRLYWAGAPEGGPAWLASELYDESLAARLRRPPPVSATERAEIALGLARGLAALHEGGVLHRDVKPANVMLGPRRVALADFGLAMISDDWTRDHGAGSRWFVAAPRPSQA